MVRRDKVPDLLHIQTMNLHHLAKRITSLVVAAVGFSVDLPLGMGNRTFPLAGEACPVCLSYCFVANTHC